MPALAESHNKGLKFRVLRRVAKVVQKYHPRGTDRLLRAIYSPDARQKDHIETVLEYDDDLSINIDTASFIEWCIFFYGHYEPEVIALIKQVVKRGDVAFDVGANIGCHTLIMARAVGEMGRVVAVEPNPKIRKRLSDNLCLNRMNQALVVDCGLSDVDGESSLYVAPDNVANQGMSSLHPQPFLTSTVPVKIETLDGLMQRSGCEKLSFVKIDTQGNDHKVLLGGAESIQKYRPYLLFEYDKTEWSISSADFATCDDFLRKNSYTLYVLGRGGALTKAEQGVPDMANIFAVPPGG